MNKLFLPILLAIAASATLSCSKVQEEKDLKHMTLAYLAVKELPAEPGPILMAEIEGDVLAMYDDPEQPDCGLFYFQDAATRNRLLMLTGEKNIFFIPAENTGNTVQIAAFNQEEGLENILVGNYNVRTGAFELTGSYPTGFSNASTKNGSYNYGDDIRRLFKRQVLDEIADKGSELGSVLSACLPKYLPVGNMLSSLCRTISVVGLAELKRDAGTDLGDEIDRSFVKIGLGTAIDLMPYSDKAAILRQVYRFSEKALTGDFPSESDIESKSGPMSSMFMWQADRFYPGVQNVEVLPEGPNPFIISFNVSNITRQGATFSGSSSARSGYTGVDAAMWEQGFKYVRERDGWDSSVRSEGLASTTVYLSEASAYVASAYVKTMGGKEYTSNAVRFVTRGTRLDLGAVAFAFGRGGGSAGTEITIGDDATLKVISAPSWCKVQYSTTSLECTVEKGYTDREGSIVLETTSPYGEKDTASIAVIQVADPWDGTMWNLHMTFHSQGTSGNAIQWIGDIPGSVSGKLFIENAAAGKYQSEMSMGDMRRDSDSALSFHQGSSETVEGPFKVWSDGTIEYGKSQVKRDWSVRLTRTDDTHVSISGSITVNVSGDWNGSSKIGIGGSGSLIQ